MERAWKFLTITNAIIAFYILFAFSSPSSFKAPVAPSPAAGDYLPTVQEVQERINALLIESERIELDGKIGRLTLDAWDKALCEQYAREYMEAEE